MISKVGGGSLLEVTVCNNGYVPSGTVVGRDQRGWQRQGTSQSVYWTHSVVGGKHSNMIWHVCLNQGGGVLYWWRNNMLVAVAEAKREVGANCEEV